MPFVPGFETTGLFGNMRWKLAHGDFVPRRSVAQNDPNPQGLEAGESQCLLCSSQTGVRPSWGLGQVAKSFFLSGAQEACSFLTFVFGEENSGVSQVASAVGLFL